MLESYKTVKQYGTADIVIKKSRFIGHAQRAESEAEAMEFIQMIKKQHAMATHHCFAYIIGERDEFQKQSDDGEPSGTAGRPILEVLKNQGLKNAAVVVVRYFGGTLLGAGGLVRAYTESAVAGIKAAAPAIRELRQEVFVEIDYTWLGKLENELKNRRMMMGETHFTDQVRLTCLPLISEVDSLSAWLTDLTQGQGTILLGNKTYYFQ